MPYLTDVSRINSASRAHAGSQRQIQTHVNQRTHVLNSAVAQSLSWYSLDENANVLTIPFRSPRRVQIQLDRLEPIRISFARSFEARLGHSQA
jgi:hypothetical protein